MSKQRLEFKILSHIYGTEQAIYLDAIFTLVPHSGGYRATCETPEGKLLAREDFLSREDAVTACEKIVNPRYQPAGDCAL